MRLTAGKGIRQAVERQVAESDITEELETVRDLQQDASGDFLLVGVQLQFPEKPETFTHRHQHDVRDRSAGDLDIGRVFPKASSAAFRTGGSSAVTA